MSFFKWTKGQALSNKDILTVLPLALSENPYVQQLLTEFFQSVAMKTDLKHVNLFESSGRMGEPLQHAAMNAAGDEMTWIDPPEVSTGGTSSGGDLRCALASFDDAEQASASAIDQNSSTWNVDYDPEEWCDFGGETSGIIVPVDGIYRVAAWYEVELNGEDSEDPVKAGYIYLQLDTSGAFGSEQWIDVRPLLLDNQATRYRIFNGESYEYADTESPWEYGSRGTAHCDGVVELAADSVVTCYAEFEDLLTTPISATAHVELSVILIKDNTA